MPRPSQPPSNIPARTIIESPEDIRSALQARRAAARPASVPPPPAPVQQPAPVESIPDVELVEEIRTAAPYRPTLRPPVAQLTVFDDGKSDGEVIRLRTERFVIGRSDGDLRLPHDELISGRHLEITRGRVGEGWRWVVTDLGTTNGLFVRVSRTILADRAEFLVGRGRYRFDTPPAEQLETFAAQLPDAGSGTTRAWGSEMSRARPPLLIELVAGAEATRIPLVAPEYWIGSDASCTICRAGDPFAEGRHVRLSRGSDGAWEARNNKTANGLWLKMPQITVDGACLFQIGEQRFRLVAGG